MPLRTFILPSQARSPYRVRRAGVRTSAALPPVVLRPATPPAVAQLAPVPVSIDFDGLRPPEAALAELQYAAVDSFGRRTEWTRLSRPPDPRTEPGLEVLPAYTWFSPSSGRIDLSEGVWGRIDGWYRHGFRYAHIPAAEYWTDWHLVGMGLRITSGIAYVDDVPTATGVAGSTIAVGGAKQGNAIDPNESSNDVLNSLAWTSLAQFALAPDRDMPVVASVNAGARTFTNAQLIFPAKPGSYEGVLADDKRKCRQLVRLTSTPAPAGVLSATERERGAIWPDTTGGRSWPQAPLEFPGLFGGGNSDAPPTLEYQDTSVSSAWVAAAPFVTFSEVVTGAQRGGRFVLTFPGSVVTPVIFSTGGNERTFTVRRTDTLATCTWRYRL